jgi:molybdopterin converting factor subunit 1
MTIRVSFFAAARELIGLEHLELQLAETATLATVRNLLAERYPQLTAIMHRSTWAVDCQYVESGHPLHDGAEIGLIPPVSGG